MTDPAINERPISRNLARIESGLDATGGTLASVDHDPSEIPLLQQHQEKLDDYKRELSSIYKEILALDLKDDHRLVILHARLEQLQFDSSHKVKKLISLISSHSAPQPQSLPTRDQNSQSKTFPHLMVMFSTGRRTVSCIST